MLQYSWSPRLKPGPEPLWIRVVSALERDLKEGAVRPGDRLPPHRELAHSLGAGVGTITRAYAEAERRGLVTSHIGRGTFVADRPGLMLAHRQGETRINLGLNVPPVAPAISRARESVAQLGHRADLAAMFDYTFTAGLPAVREAGAKWLSRFAGVARAGPERIIQTNGGQHALMIACSSFAGRGDTVLCDRATYPGNRTIAEHGGWHLHGVPAKGSGMDPAALDRAAAETDARLIILVPTLQNPTARTMNASVRADIVEVCRSRDLIIVEDDIYRVFGREDEPDPFADLAPERTVYATSISKALSPGLRLGFLLAPENPEFLERLLLGAQATGYCPPAAGGLVFADWMANGLAPEILNEVRTEMAQRLELARKVLGDAMDMPDSERSLHVWLPMEPERAGQVYADCLKAGVELTPPEAPFVDGSPVSGLRICLGTPLERTSLEQGLLVIRSALDIDQLVNRKGIV